MDTNLRVVVSKEDSGLKELLESLGKLQSLFGGAIPAAVSKGAAAMKQSHTQVVESVKQGNAQIAQSVAQTAEKNKGRTIAELQEELALRDKSKKQIVQLQTSLAEEVKNVARQVTMTLDAEEKKRLQNTQKELKAELAAVKEEAEKRGIESKKGGMDRKREFSDVGLLQVAGIGAAVEGLNKLKEKAEETANAQRQLQAGTGASGAELAKLGQQAEVIGDKFAMSDEAVKVTMGKVASYTGASGEELQKQTEAVVAYGKAHGKNAEMVAKMLSTETGRMKVLSEATVNIAKAQQAAKSPAEQFALIQEKLGNIVGETSLTVLNALGPAIKAVVPIISQLGDLIGNTIGPLFQKLSPVVEEIAKVFAAIAPVVSNLISGALSALAPILDVVVELMAALLPPIMQVISTIGGALIPIFSAIKPVIAVVADIIKQVLMQNIGLLTNLLQNVLVPVLQIVAPLIQALAPILQLVGMLIQSVVLPIALKLVDLALWPLTKVLGLIGKGFTALQKPIQDVVGWITGAVDKIKGAIGAVTSFLGLGDKAKDATKQAGDQIKVQAQKNADELAQQQIIQQGQQALRDKHALAEKLKLGKLSAAEEQQLREQAQDEGDEMMLKKLDDFDKKKDAKGAAAAKKNAAARFEAAKAEADAILADKKDEIAALDLEDSKAKAQTRLAEIAHEQAILEISRKTFGEKSKQYLAEYHKFQALSATLKKDERADAISAASNETNILIAEFNTRADKELMSDKERMDGLYKIELDGIAKRLALVQSGSKEEAALLRDKAALEAKHAKEQRTREIALQKELAKGELEARKAQLEILKTSGAQAAVILKEDNAIAIAEEEQRYKEEKEARKDDLNDTKLGHALAESLETNHVNKLKAIDAQGAAQRKQIWMQNMQLLAGPITKGIMGGITQMTAGVHKLTQSWQQSGGVLGTIFGGILDSFVTMIEGMIEKIVAMEAILLVANLIPGFSAFMDMFQSFTSAIPTQATGLATGGVLKGATVMGAGVLTRPTFLASGGTMPIVAGEIPNEAVIPLNAYPGAKAMMQGDLGFSDHADRIIAAIQNSGQNVATAAGRTKYGVPINDTWRSVTNISSKAEDRRSF